MAAGSRPRRNSGAGGCSSAHTVLDGSHCPSISAVTCPSRIGRSHGGRLGLRVDDVVSLRPSVNVDAASSALSSPTVTEPAAPPSRPPRTRSVPAASRRERRPKNRQLASYCDAAGRQRPGERPSAQSGDVHMLDLAGPAGRRSGRVPVDGADTGRHAPAGDGRPCQRNRRDRHGDHDRNDEDIDRAPPVGDRRGRCSVSAAVAAHLPRHCESC